MRPTCALIALALSASLSSNLPAFADTQLPATLTGTLTNPADQSIIFGSPTTTASLTMSNGSSFTNLGTWTAYAGTIQPATFYNTPTFSGSILNTGTLNIDASAGPLSILDFPSPLVDPTAYPFTFTNTGTINLLAGTFNLAASDTGNSSGTITLGANTTLGLAANLTFNANSSLTGSGNILLSTNIRSPGGSPYVPTFTNTPPAITFNGNYATTGTTTIIGESVTFNTNATLNNLQVSSGTNAIAASLAGTGTITLAGSGSPVGTFYWTGGPAISGGVISANAIAVTGTLFISPASGSEITLSGTAITVQQGASMSLGTAGSLKTINVMNGASITNNGTMVADVFLNNSSRPNSFTFTNNGVLHVYNLTMGSAVQFINNGTINVYQGTFELAGLGSESADSIINLRAGVRMYDGVPRSFYHGTLNNAGSIEIINNTITLGTSLTFNHSGALGIDPSGKLILQSSQQAFTTGTFQIDAGDPSTPPGTLEFAASYDFSSPTGPSFAHNSSGDGLLIIDPGFTLTLPSDTPFSGTIQDNGTLIIAPPLNPANAGLSPNFTVLTPEPASLALLTLALPLLLPRRKAAR